MIDKSYLYKTDGDVLPIYPKGEKFTLQELQALVGGYVEIVDVHEDFYAICDEEGKIKGKDGNEKATTLAHTKGTLPLSDFFVGDIVFIPKHLIS